MRVVHQRQLVGPADDVPGPLPTIASPRAALCSCGINDAAVIPWPPPSVATTPRCQQPGQGKDEKGAIKPQWRPIRRVDIDMAESAAGT